MTSSASPVFSGFSHGHFQRVYISAIHSEGVDEGSCTRFVSFRIKLCSPEWIAWCWRGGVEEEERRTLQYEPQLVLVLMINWVDFYGFVVYSSISTVAAGSLSSLWVPSMFCTEIYRYVTLISIKNSFPSCVQGCRDFIGQHTSGVAGLPGHHHHHWVIRSMVAILGWCTQNDES